ncbi:uncharacterized protein EI90DRAFT_3012614 [Cantharellus anzutake]|uniref:uncharacterized protein n=1 Tax=Cantharellus anzutake TaxID=1750568 RepID=UPI0019058C80|nr:uncharacterized protein EI90DRAFT_3012614 [Cantharellus anzutake]KAF8339626.1 hypothetical protein EI90DRAFT_3012614 [Cantharellus anzutake]
MYFTSLFVSCILASFFTGSASPLLLLPPQMNELAFFHQTPHPRIYAQFQQCTPNWANSTNFSFTKWGRIYIPQYKQCLAVTEPYGPQPYVVKRVPCLNSAAGEMATPKSIPQNWDVDSRGFMTWTGKTKEDGSLVQGDGSCKPGAYGYLSDKHHEPITGKSGEYRASLVCIWDQDAAAFYMTQN